MRFAPASHLRGRYARPVQAAPREGTYLREVYDLFMANKGIAIEFTTQRNRRVIEVLTDFYGLDIRCLRRGHRHCRKSQWVLAGEWFGRSYQDCIAERLEAA
jgi:hypothetical protein